MNMPDAVRHVLSNYATFSGRARRSEFWWWYLATLIAGVVLNIVDSALGTGGILAGIFALAIIVPQLAVGARRLHDTGRSGWLQLLGIIPIIGIILLIVWWAGDSKPDNQHGPNPKGAGLPGTSPYTGI
ncbi:DUF805 domain-containing protein [Nocardioides sp. AX2bis]|uniref:DUF805 domain-containing protein n=1 Tax=Nocardioides sp. AX2bis TaxID=2653157 RepID=UPI0012F0698D|nr:DUF805 domain-containing protein [Nocardioides sp. AX2bis]VXC25019.1 Inner membrane protein YhaH [Nocardioides sp. AX2bis]